MALLSVENLESWYEVDEPVLHDLSFEIGEEEIIGLIGLNGSGKTTLINTLSDVHDDYRASVDFSDRDFKLTRYTVFSEDNAFDYLIFDEYLELAFNAYEKTPDKELVDALSEGFGFERHRKHLIGDLSMGNRKKVYLITAFALRLPLLIFDEPVNGLDFSATEFLYKTMNEYRHYGTIFFSSHVVESIALTCDRLFVLREGRIVKSLASSTIDSKAIREALYE